MKALQVEAPGKVQLVDVPSPQPKPGEVLLRVRMVGRCGTDLSTFRGSNPLVSYPRIPGHEIAATVEAAPSSGNGTLQPGTNVTVSPYANCGSCAACRRGRPNACAERIYPAEGLQHQELALVEPLSIGFHAVARGRVLKEDTVAIFGCGGVGLGAIAGAARRGATVIGIDIDDRKLHLAQAAGARFTIHSQRDQLNARLQELTAGHGPDVIIEAIGSAATFRAAVDEVAFTGRVVYLGYTKEPVSYETRHFVQKELDIMGSRNAAPENFCAVIEMLQQRAFPVDEAISKIVPLAEAPAALEEWNAHPTKFSKILVRVD
jgi:threonine dehydrogenase-like Zn-dependent dehydrogenase